MRGEIGPASRMSFRNRVLTVEKSAQENASENGLANGARGGIRTHCLKITSFAQVLTCYSGVCLLYTSVRPSVGTIKQFKAIFFSARVAIQSF